MSAAQALSKVATLGYACLCIGLILFIYGKASDNLTVDLVGGRVLVIGVMLVAVRILFWVAGKIVERGRREKESIGALWGAPQKGQTKASSTTRGHQYTICSTARFEQ